MDKCNIKRLGLVGLSLLISTTAAMAQSMIKVTGKVVDRDGEPMIGVSIFDKSKTGTGAVTDLDGKFTINVAKGAKLRFSYIGYEPVEIVASQAIANVTMREDDKTIDEVVVVGYGVQKKSSVTGSISQVKAADLENRTVTNAQAALQGKTSGVQVIQASGAPGSAPAIRVRGYSSNSDMSPLYVVDGVRKSNIAGIDPNDIESIEVLKDAASAAIYGAQAGNGVVLVSTKRGKKGRQGYGNISYDFQIASQSIAKVPKRLNSEQYIEYMLEADIFNNIGDVWSRGWDGVTNTDWADVTFENSIMTKHNLSMQGANDRGSYYVSASYLDNDGIVKGNKDTYSRITGVVNADYKVKPWLKVGINTQTERYKQRSIASSGTFSGNMMAAVLQLDPLTPNLVSPDNLPSNMKTLLQAGQPLLKNKDGMYYGISPYYDSEQIHPMILRDRSEGKTEGWNINGAAYLDLTPWKHLVITSRLGYRFYGYHTPSYSHKYYGSNSAANKYIGISATTANGQYYQWENFANYHQTFAEKHDVTAMVGMSYSESRTYSTSGSFTGNDEVGDAVSKDDPYGFGDLNYGLSGATKGVSGGTGKATQTSYFGRVGYAFADKYMVQASLRADAYDLSKLPRTHRWGYFPAVSAGWEIAKEGFMKSTAKWLNSLKLRLSWGRNGSVAPLGNYLYSTDMASSGIYPMGMTPPYDYVYGARPATMGNDELSWEKSDQTNVGLDGVLFNGRLTFGLDYYVKKTKDLLVTGVTPSLVVGGSASPMNAGDVENKGFELELGWRDNIGDFSYSVKGNFSTLSNKVTYLHPSITRLSGYSYSNNTITAFEVGHPVWYFYGYKFSHIDPETGAAVMKDLDGNGTVNEDDKTEIGCAIPKGTYGITINAAYKGFDLSVFGSGQFGNDIFMCLQRQDKLTSNRLKEIWYDGRWIAGADNSHATRPAANANIDQYIYSDAMVYSGSYFKIKQIQLGYSLPARLLKKARINRCRLYVSLEDFFTFTSYKGFDPEVSAGTGAAQGIDEGGYPFSKKVTAGISLSF